jgi:rhodanese-related sulfurtransferase
MVTEVTRHDVQRLIEGGAQLVDVLDAKEYADSHLPGAVNIPLAKLSQQARQQLDPATPTVSYCYDSLCDMSPRGAWRLASVGFREVYDYVASKVDWIGAGLPFEGSRAEQPHLATLADRDTPTCAIDELAADVRRRTSDTQRCVVVNEHRVVLGLVAAEALDSNGARIADVMQEAPRTFRPHVTAVEMIDQLDHLSQSWLLVTNLDGTLVGIADTDRIRHAADTATLSRQ